MKKKKGKLPDYQAELPRFCEHCGRPLPPGEHGLRKFCEKWYDQVGQVHDCKTDYHSEKKKPQNEEFRLYRNTIYEDSNTITSLVDKFGSIVTTAQLDAHDLELCRSIEYGITDDGKIISQVHGYIITSDTSIGKHKIEKI
jgi:hypothetical protein